MICPAFRFGENCSYSCNCTQNNTKSCNVINGTCTCKPGWTSNDCSIDINECQLDPLICPEYSTCVNLNGSYECVCYDGLTTSANRTCSAINQCSERNCSHLCTRVTLANQTAVEKCYCPTGTLLSGDICQNCSNLTYGKNCALSCNCISNTTASCDNRMGTCYCLPGWTSQNCSVDINECLYTSCGLYSYCTNTPGSYKCSCSSGYILDDAGYCVRESCIKTLNSSTGVIQSPNYPNYYYTNLQCKWTIIVEQDHIISLRFSTYAVEGCPYDFVQVFDGKSSSDRLIGKYCTSASIPNQIMSTSNMMYITFVSDGVYTDKGFNATYTSFGCPAFRFGENCSYSCNCTQNNTKSCNVINGTCTCKPGWTSNDCSIDINECQLDPLICPEYSTCVNLNGSYECVCYDGLTSSDHQTCSAVVPHFHST
ncbi:neurogenic locus notch homolog protein 1-like [Physella acuta]|uniref:neurogenic locus notch homolog protein 1-like n=1 Tax=Physella acuta TaxID=109671 RepID=UPI0027DE2DEA|nr:neurogenic locus notch homolog protein 1-like [Physella acuta]